MTQTILTRYYFKKILKGTYLKLEFHQYDKEALSRRMKEILLQCYKFGFEYHKELDRLITGKQSRQLFCSGVISFSTQWMK